MIPMSRPGWFDELPESMSEAEYRELPEDEPAGSGAGRRLTAVIP
jgi:hypothetical protein